MEYRPIAAWLRATRLRQTLDNGESWTQEYLLDRMQSEIGWAPARPNYSRYENGKATPNRETLAKLTEFWAAQGEAGPDLTPVEEVEPVDPQLVLAAALNRQAAAMERQSELMTGSDGPDTRPSELVTLLREQVEVSREQTQAIREQTAALAEVLRLLTERSLDPAAVAALETWGREAAATLTRSPQRDPRSLGRAEDVPASHQRGQ